MIIPVNSIASSGGVPGSVAAEYDFVPSEGETIQIPESTALLINVLLWPEAPINEIELVLPSLLSGRRVFIFAKNQVSQITLGASEQGTEVANNVASMNMNDLIVFNAVSMANKIWARVATS